MLVDSGVRMYKITVPCDFSVILAGKAGRCRNSDEPVGQGQLQVCFTISFTGGLPPPSPLQVHHPDVTLVLGDREIDGFLTHGDGAEDG